MGKKGEAAKAAAGDGQQAGPTAIGGLEMTTAPAAPSGGAPTKNPPAAAQDRGRGIDMWAHNGLRGGAAVWIVIFHCYGLPKRSDLRLNLQGHSMMPMFFLLSGFALAATYGKKKWAAATPVLQTCHRQRQPAEGAAAVEEGRAAEAALPRFPLRSFYQNRFARVMPVYYFTLLMCLPLWLINVGDIPFARDTFIPSLVTSVIPCTTLLSPLSGSYIATLNPPGWFVCTLVVFFLIFPRWLVTAQRLSDAQLLARVVWHYYLQLVLLLGIFYALPLVAPGLRPFTTATQNPLTRFPLFLMGIYTGLLALRHPAPAVDDEPKPKAATAAAKGDVAGMGPVAAAAGGSPTAAVERAMAAAQPLVTGGGGGASTVDEPMPWPACFLGCFPVPPRLAASRCGRALLLPLSSQPPTSMREWARTATWQSAGILLFVLAIAAADSYLQVDTDGRMALRGHVWLQALVPMVQLNILVALTRDGRLSLASRALGTRLAQWLGKVSMDVYLVHWPIIAYTALALHGPHRFETLLNCYGVMDQREADPERYDKCLQAMAEAKRFPPWGVCIILPLSLAVGELLYRYVNEPARKLLRSREGPAGAGKTGAGKAKAKFEAGGE